jgi:DNA-binding beta-propeller fold protein YncE
MNRPSPDPRSPSWPALPGAALILALAVAAGSAPCLAQDMPSGTVLVGNMDDDSVWLIDVPSGVRRAVIPTHIAPHEVAVSADGRVAVVTNYGDQRGPGNLIQILDVARGTVTGEIEVDGYERLHGIAFLPGDSLLVLTSERTGEILVVGLSDRAVRRKLPTGGRASHMLSLGGPWIYAANITDGTVSRIDPAGASATLTWPAGTRTEGVAATPDGLEGWTGSMEGGDVVGVEGTTGTVVARVTGLGVPYRLAVTPDGNTVLVSDPEHHALVLIDRHAGSLLGRVDVAAAATEAGLGAEPSPQGFTVSPDGRWAFVSTKEVNSVAVVDLRTRRVVRFLPSGAGPDGIAFSPVRGGGS